MKHKSIISIIFAICIIFITTIFVIAQQSKGSDSNTNISNLQQTVSTTAQKYITEKGWKLVFSDGFSGNYSENESSEKKLAHQRFRRITYDGWEHIKNQGDGGPDWRRYISRDPELVEFVDKDGFDTVVLWGHWGQHTNHWVGASWTDKKETYGCGGIETVQTFSLRNGYVEVRGKTDLRSTHGFWPALWLNSKSMDWAIGGEVDILELLSPDIQTTRTAYQTVHETDASYGYRNRGGGRKQLPDGDQDKQYAGWNTYGAAILEDKIIFYLNGEETATVKKEYDTWPWEQDGNELYIYLDQQIGGTWVGAPNSTTQNAAKNNEGGKGVGLYIDYVKVYADPSLSYKGSIDEKCNDGVASNISN